MYKFKITQTSILMIVSFKENSGLCALGRKKQSHNIFFIHFVVWYGNCPVTTTCWGKRLKGYAKTLELKVHLQTIATTSWTGGLQKGIPDKFVMERTEPKDVRSLQKYQRPDTSSKIEISKKFDCFEAVSLPESVTSEKVSIKRDVDQTRKK